MTSMEHRYWQVLGTGVTKVEAARRAGSKNPPNYVRSMTRGSSRRAKLSRLLHRLEVTEAKALRPMAEALEATKVLVAVHDGKFTDTKEVPDWEHRLKASDWIATHLGLKPPGELPPPVELAMQVTAIDALCAVVQRQHSLLAPSPTEAHAL